MPFGLSLIRMRSRLGISQAELARRAGVSQSTVSEIENQTCDPKLSTALKIIWELEVRVLEMIPSGKGYELRSWTGCVSCNPETLDEIANQLAIIRGRAQLAEESLSCSKEVPPPKLAHTMSAIINATDKLAAIIGLAPRLGPVPKD